MSKTSLREKIAELVRQRKEGMTAGEEISAELLSKIAGGSGGAGADGWDSGAWYDGKHYKNVFWRAAI
jgi:hypothetical protein